MNPNMQAPGGATALVPRPLAGAQSKSLPAKGMVSLHKAPPSMIPSPSGPPPQRQKAHETKLRDEGEYINWLNAESPNSTAALPP